MREKLRNYIHTENTKLLVQKKRSAAAAVNSCRISASLAVQACHQLASWTTGDHPITDD